jgi:hypothetical protein
MLASARELHKERIRLSTALEESIERDKLRLAKEGSYQGSTRAYFRGRVDKAKCRGHNEKASLKAYSRLHWEASFASVPEWRNWQTR